MPLCPPPHPSPATDEPLAYEEEEADLHPAARSPTGKAAAAAAAAAAALLQAGGGGEKRKAAPLGSGLAPSGALVGPASGPQVAAVGDGAAVPPKRRKKAGGGGGGSSHFVEMEAELSDEDGEGADVSEDEDEPDAEEDGMLVRGKGVGSSTGGGGGGRGELSVRASPGACSVASDLPLLPHLPPHTYVPTPAGGSD